MSRDHKCTSRVRCVQRSWTFRVKCMSGMPHMPAAEGFTCQAGARVATCHMCTHARHAVTCAGGLHVSVSVSSPSRALGVVVSHRLSFSANCHVPSPQISPPTQPCTTHPHSKICVAASLSHPPTMLSSFPRGKSLPLQLALPSSSLPFPTLCLSSGD